MKVLFGLLVSTMFVASAANAAIDCQKIVAKSITVDVKSEKEIPGLLSEFYNCSQQDPDVVVVKQQVVNNAPAGEDFCKFQDPKVIEVTSWKTGRYSVYGEAGGEYKYVYLLPYYCSAVGTGLFEGITGNAHLTVLVSQSEKNLEFCAPGACEGQKNSNRVTLTLEVLH